MKDAQDVICLLDMDERLVDLIKKGVILSASPVTDLKIPEDGVEIGIIEGSVATDTQRRRSKNDARKM